MRRGIAGLGILAIAASLAACGGKSGTTTDNQSAGGAGASGTITIWADDTRYSQIEEFAKDFTASSGVSVSVVQKSESDMDTEFTTQVPTGNGPDLIVMAHDKLGSLVSNGVVAPVDLGDKSKFSDVAVKAVTYGGQTYGVPYAVESVALVRNNKLTTDTPATFADTLTSGQAAGVQYPFVVQMGEHGIGDIISTSLPHMGETFGQLDLAGAWHYGLVSIIFTFTVVELFDNMGTLIGVTTKAKMVKPDGHIENIDKALTTDAVGTMVSAVFGTSTVTSYVESAAGIAAGGRTGLTAVAAGVLFLAALLFAPLIGLVPAFATAPALILVGALLMSEVGKIDFSDFTNALPAFLTIIMMPLTSSIANGFAFGFISYTVMKLFAGQYKKVSWIMYLVSIAFLINLALRS